MQIHDAKPKLLLGLKGPPEADLISAALQIAFGIVGDWEKITVIYTPKEPASSSVQNGLMSTISMTGANRPEAYFDALDFARDFGAQAIVIDAMSHAWDDADENQLLQAGSTTDMFAQWASLSPDHHLLISSLMNCGAHVIFLLQGAQFQFSSSQAIECLLPDFDAPYCF